MNRRSFLQTLSFAMLAMPRSLLRGMGLNETPESVARHAWEQMQRGDSRWLLESFEPEALEELRRVLTKMVQLADRDGQADEILDLFQVESVSQVRELDDREFFAAIWPIGRHEPGLFEMAQDVDFHPVAPVHTQRGRVYVLYRLTSYRTDLLLPIWPKVIGLEKIPTGWALLPNRQLEGWERFSFETHDLAQLPGNLSAKITGVIGHVREGDHTYIVIRSTTELQPLRLTQVGVLPLANNHSALRLLRRGETQKALQWLNRQYRL
jgi:hypothetical protein